MCWKKGSWQHVLWTLGGAPQTQHPWAALHRAEPRASSRGCGEQRHDFASATEGASLPGLNTRIETSQSSLNSPRWMLGFFNTTQTPGRGRELEPCSGFLEVQEIQILFYRTDQSALAKAPFCSGSVWLSSVAQGGPAQACLHKHQFLQEIHAQQCTWRNASSIKNQLLKRNPYYLNMGARLVNLKAHMKPISCNFVAIYNWGCVDVCIIGFKCRSQWTDWSFWLFVSPVYSTTVWTTVFYLEGTGNHPAFLVLKEWNTPPCIKEKICIWFDAKTSCVLCLPLAVI